MSPGQLLDAFSAAFFALLGVWAAMDQRHWFLRFAVVSVFLFACLLIPAFEIVLEFGLLILLINAGVWLANARSNWPPRLSMESALLAMVVVAVVCAFVGALPELSPHMWAFCLRVGVCASLIALGCVALVYGRGSLLRRTVSFVLLLTAAMVSFALIEAGKEAVEYAQRGQGWQAGFVSVFNASSAGRAFSNNAPAVALGIAIILAALLLARETRWFHSTDGEPAPPRWRLLGSRAGLSVILVAVFTPLFYVFVRLLAPPSLPDVPIPDPNGYDDILAAGRMEPYENLQKIAQQFPSKPAALLLSKEERLRIESICERIDQGLAKEIAYPHKLPGERDGAALLSSCLALVIRAELAFNRHGLAAGVEAYRAVLEFGQRINQAHGGEVWLSRWAEQLTIQNVSARLLEYNAQECRSARRILLDYDSGRTPIERQKVVQRIWDDNSDWQQHLWNIIADWSGEDRYKWLEPDRKARCSSMRLLISQLALQEHLRDHGFVPESLHRLVPDYLESVPQDPYGEGPLRSAYRSNVLSVYSVGVDGVDQTRASGRTPASSDDQTITASAYTATQRKALRLARFLETLAPPWLQTAQHFFVEIGHHIRENLPWPQQAEAL